MRTGMREHSRFALPLAARARQKRSGGAHVATLAVGCLKDCSWRTPCVPAGGHAACLTQQAAAELWEAGR